MRGIGWFGVIALGGCTAAQYTHGIEDLHGVSADADDGLNGVETLATLGTHEILLLDRTGVACAAVTNTVEQAGEAQDVRHQAERNGPGIYTAEYTQYSPAAFRGLDCGGYYRWGKGDGAEVDAAYDASTGDRTESAERPNEMALFEIGFHASGREIIFDKVPWLQWTALFRFGVGRFDYVPEYDPLDGVTIRAPLQVGLAAYPPLLQGFGLEPWVGHDVVAGIMARGRGPFKLDYGFSANWGVPLGPVSLAASAGYRQTNQAVADENWYRASGPFGGLTVAYNFRPKSK